jgi:PepSY-associated TM region
METTSGRRKPRSVILHKWLGIALLLPLLVWSITGSIFLTKPGYEQAYDKLPIKTYPTSPRTEADVLSTADILMLHEQWPQWQQLKILNTVLGQHLLVMENDQWRQLSPTTAEDRTPTNTDVRVLIEDAFRANPSRYGNIIALDGLQVTTDTNVIVTLNWNEMKLVQRGDDTRRIQWLYKMHYLQWSGNTEFDKILALFGLVCLSSMTLLGGRLLFLR